MTNFINMNIPGKIAWDELEFLGTLASKVPKNGRIVEIGPFFGRSTYTIAQSASGASVTSIDTFEDAEWIRNYTASSKAIPQFGLESFKHFTADCENVTPVKGFSPQVLSDWSKPIDMYFEDAIHGNPGLKNNMDFWISHLRPGGIVCGHDYTLRFPDVKREADTWAKIWGTRPEIVGSLWALRKPKGTDPDSPPISRIVGSFNKFPCLNVRTKNRRSGYHNTLSGYWAGAHLEADALNWVILDWKTPVPGLDIQYRVGHPEFGTSDWQDAGQKALIVQGDRVRPIWDFAARLTGPRAGEFKVFYRLTFRQIGRGGHKLSEISNWTSTGQWCRARCPGAPACSITVMIAKDEPPHPQEEFGS